MPNIVDLSKPYGGKGKYGDTFAGIANILDSIGKVERLRQDRALNAKVINVVAMGGGPEQIAQALVEAQPQYSTGATGFLQQIANQFAPPSMIESRVGEMGMESAFKSISPSQMMAQERWNRYQQAKAAGDTDTADRLLSSALVNFNVPLSPEDQAIMNRLKVDKATGKTGPGFGPGDKKAIATEMDTRLKNSKRSWYSQVGRPNYTEAALFGEWKKLIAQNTFANDNQRENTWATWKEKVNKKNKEGWFGNEVDWDPTDPKWREAIGLEADGSRGTPTGGDIIVTLEGTPAQRSAIDVIVKKRITTEDKQTLINQVLNNERIRVKDNTGKIGTVPADQLVEWLSVSGNTLAVEDRRK